VLKYGVLHRDHTFLFFIFFIPCRECCAPRGPDSTTKAPEPLPEAGQHAPNDPGSLELSGKVPGESY
jgi:hypothetical protein